MSKSWQKLQNSDFQSHFSISKIILIYLKKNSLMNIILRAQFFYLHFLTTSIFRPLTFTQLTARLNFFLMGWLLLLGLKSGRMCDIVRKKWGHTYILTDIIYCEKCYNVKLKFPFLIFSWKRFYLVEAEEIQQLKLLTGMSAPCSSNRKRRFATPLYRRQVISIIY